MTAFLQRGDKIILAAPDFRLQNTLDQDRAHWERVFEPLGIEVSHLTVSGDLTHPVVVAVIRPQLEVAVTDERPF